MELKEIGGHWECGDYCGMFLDDSDRNKDEYWSGVISSLRSYLNYHRGDWGNMPGFCCGGWYNESYGYVTFAGLFAGIDQNTSWENIGSTHSHLSLE